MKAIIMAGGEGTRLRPMTCGMPKPMVRVMNRPILETTIELLRKHQVTDIAVTLAYLPQTIITHFGDGSDFGVHLTYFTETTPLGTAGSIKNASSFIDDEFLVLSGDALTDIDLSAAIAYHREKDAFATILLSRQSVPLEYGVVVTEADGRVSRFVEKPRWSEVTGDTVNTGIYVFKKEIVDYIPSEVSFDFARDLFPLLQERGKALYGFQTDGYWCDIGDLNAYRRCHNDILDGKVALHLRAEETERGLWVEQGAVLEQGAILSPPLYIGAGSVIKRGARLEGYCVVGQGVTVFGGASAKRSILQDGVRLSAGAQIRGAVLDCGVSIGRNSAVYEQAIIGHSTTIEDNCTIRPAVKIWPEKRVESGCSVSNNLIWGAKQSLQLFDCRDIHGRINVEITPDFMLRIGQASGTVLGKKLAISSDGSPVATMLRGALAAGILATGASIYDFGDQPLPITRSGIAFYQLDGGVALDVYEEGGETFASVDLLEQHGASVACVTQRRIEQMMAQRDFLRADPSAVREAEYLFEYKLYYLKNLINSTSKKELNLKALIVCKSDWGQRLLRSAAGDLKCDFEIEAQSISFHDGHAVEEFAKRTVERGADFGAILDHKCEKLLLVDRRGRVVEDDAYTALISLIVLRQFEGASLYVPVSAPSTVEQLAAKYGGVVHRTKNSPSELMAAFMAQETPALQTQFVYHYDAVGALIQLMDFMRSQRLDLATLIDELPSAFLVHTEVECPTDKKSSVVRYIAMRHRARPLEMTDGVKVNLDRGWVLVIPDHLRPVCSVVSEGCSAEYAREIADDFIEEIAKMT